MKKQGKIRVSLRWFLIAAGVIVVCLVFCGIYLNDYYRADADGIAAFSPAQRVTKRVWRDGVTAYEPDEIRAGMIFYPGGKVECAAYDPLMSACAEKGVLCVLLEMPFNLAVLDIDAADGIREMYPKIHRWYIGGHSLGGSMAAAYVAKHATAYDGLIMLAAYSTSDLSDGEISVLSVYGSEDGVMNAEKYSKNKGNLPENCEEVIIDGGCHAYFGMYGEQKGDGTASISNEEQILFTADVIAEFVAEKK